MCGPTSAISLEEHERAAWTDVKNSLRESGMLAGLMRGLLGNEEVAVVISTAPSGEVHPVAVIVTVGIAAELTVPETSRPGWVAALVGGEFDVEVFVGATGHPVAMKVTDWISESVLLYARRLWWPRYVPKGGDEGT